METVVVEEYFPPFQLTLRNEARSTLEWLENSMYLIYCVCVLEFCGTVEQHEVVAWENTNFLVNFVLTDHFSTCMEPEGMVTLRNAVPWKQIWLP